MVGPSEGKEGVGCWWDGEREQRGGWAVGGVQVVDEGFDYFWDGVFRCGLLAVWRFREAGRGCCWPFLLL